MFDIRQFFKIGQNNSILVKNNGSFSYDGPFVPVYETTEIDRWYVGDFSTVEYNISCDLDSDNKEFIKAIITATVDQANVVVYARNNTNRDLVELTATVNESFVSVQVAPAIVEGASSNSGVKAIYTAHYYHTQNPPVA